MGLLHAEITFGKERLEKKEATLLMEVLESTMLQLAKKKVETGLQRLW